jgi:hypothetical protein
VKRPNPKVRNIACIPVLKATLWANLTVSCDFRQHLTLASQTFYTMMKAGIMTVAAPIKGRKKYHHSSPSSHRERIIEKYATRT